MKLRFTLLLPLLLWATLASGQNTQESSALNKPSKSSNAKRDLIMQICTIEQKKCNCMADELIKNLNDKEWNLFQAFLNNAEEPPQGTTEEDLQKMENKLKSIDQTCGLNK